MVSKASGQWVTSKRDPSKKVFFLNVQGKADMEFAASYLYANGKSKLIRVIGRFINNDGTTIRLEGEGILKALRHEAKTTQTPKKGGKSK